MADFTRPPGFRFSFGGVNTRDVPDALPPEKYQAGENIRATGAQAIRTRPGYVPLFSTGNNAVTDIRAYTAIQTDALPRFLARSANGPIWLDNNNSVGNLNGNAGYGASMLPFRPAESPNPWMYIGSQGDYKKFSAPDSNNNVTAYKVGIAEPQQQLEACPIQFAWTEYTYNNSWTSSGDAGNASQSNRSNDSVVAVLADPVDSTRVSLQVGNNAAYGVFETIQCGASPVYTVILDVCPPIQNTTIQSIRYRSGSTGRCTITPNQEAGGVTSQSFAQLRRGSVVQIASEKALVLGVNRGPNGLFNFETSTAGTYSAGNNVSGVPAVVGYAYSTISPGDNIVALQMSSNINVSNNGSVATGIYSMIFAGSPFNVAYFAGGNKLPQTDDYMHFSFAVSDPTQLNQISIYFTLDPGGNNFNGNVLYYAVRPSDLVFAQAGNQNLISMILQGAENEIIGGLPTGENISAPGISAAGNNQWGEISFPVSALNRLGGDASKTLSNATGVQIKVNVSNNVTFSWGSFWVGGGGQPDVGADGVGYRYLAVPLNSGTGIRGNPTPVMRYTVTPRRQSVLVKTSDLNSAYDSQIDTWEIYRYGGSVTSYRFIGTVPTGSDFIDTTFDEAARGGSAVVIDNTEPWPTIDLPWRVTSNNANISASGPFLTVSTANNNFPPLIQNWLPGTLFQVGGNEAYTLRSRPIISGANNNICTFEMEECMPSGNQTPVFVLEPNVAAQPLPYLWGPNEQGFIFGCGDPLRAGTVSWCKGFNADASPTAYNLELCPPSEPLLGGEVLRGISIIASSFRWWALYFQQAGKPMFSPVQLPVGKRLAAPFSKYTDGDALYFWATDCIAVTEGGPAVSLTDEDLYNLFPHGGLSGSNVIRGDVTFYAPDYSRVVNFRISMREGIIYALYQDSDGNQRTLIGEKRGNKVAWSTDTYANSMTAVYAIEQPKGALQTPPSLYPAVVMGSNDGKVWKLQDLYNDNNTAISGKVSTFEFNGGELRANTLWGDLYLDAKTPYGLNATPISQSNNVANTTVIPANNNRQFSPVSANGGILENFIGLKLQWTDNFGSLDTRIPTTLHIWQPSLVAKPETIQDRYGDWYDFGGASYVKGIVFHADTYGQNKSFLIRNSDNNGTVLFQSTSGNGVINHNGEQEKAYYFDPPFVTHMVREEPQDSVPWRKFGIEWIKDTWPELSNIASAWMPVLPGGGAAFLQGLVIPVDSSGAAPILSLKTDTGVIITLTPHVTPTANIKTGVPYSLDTPVVCHQVQIVPTEPCRIWTNEIQWIAEPTPELATTWETQWTDLGVSGYKSIPKIEAAYASTEAVGLTITSFDGPSPAVIGLPATGGVMRRIFINLTPNKGQLYKFRAVSAQTCQIFANDFIVWVAQWGRSDSMIQYHNLGADFGDRARI